MAEPAAGAQPPTVPGLARAPLAADGNPTFPLADAVRAIAILGVVLCHASVSAIGQRWWGRLAWQGQIGVDIFFTLSGFLLYRPYLAARAAGRPVPAARRFLRRRVLRIVPMYWLALTVLAVWPGLPGVFTSDWWRYYFFLQVYPVGQAGVGLGVAWTLCIEVTFYLALPLYAAPMARIAKRWRGGWLRHELLMLALLSIASLALRHGVYYGHVPTWTSGTLAFQFPFFAVGMALAMFSVAADGSPSQPRVVRVIERFPGACLWLAMLAFLVMAHFVPRPDPAVPQLHLRMQNVGFARQEATQWLIALVSLLLLLPVVFGDARRGVSRRVLGSWPIIGLGAISYSVYLWHVQLLGVAVVPLVSHHPGLWFGGTAVPALFAGTLALTVPLSIVSYRFVELPFLRRRYRGRGAPERAVPAGRALPGAAAPARTGS